MQWETVKTKPALPFDEPLNAVRQIEPIRERIGMFDDMAPSGMMKPAKYICWFYVIDRYGRKLMLPVLSCKENKK
ncbi:hypothetical protein [Thiolapillus sp.]|uniref:hypothetical protein n=1 Tax=Thiolapillus sp. TaxID=2017437 RepID=UPI003AF44AB4